MIEPHRPTELSPQAERALAAMQEIQNDLATGYDKLVETLDGMIAESKARVEGTNALLGKENTHEPTRPTAPQLRSPPSPQPSHERGRKPIP